MLEKIASIKATGKTTEFDAETLNDSLTLLRQEGFVSSCFRFTEPVTVKPIINPTTLEQYAKVINSCLYKKHGQKQTDAYARFLADEGAVYFSIDSAQYAGYFRFYVGESEENIVLFEDALRVKERSNAEDPVIYLPQFKAVVLETLVQLEPFGLELEKSYLFVPDANKDSFQGIDLRIQKLGSAFFKKGFPVEFYSGQQEDQYMFASAQSLCE